MNNFIDKNYRHKNIAIFSKPFKRNIMYALRITMNIIKNFIVEFLYISHISLCKKPNNL